MTYRKKFTLTLMVFVVGSVLAFTTEASLGAYTAFAMSGLASFGIAAAADQKLNGGVSAGRPRNRSTGTSAD